jgi:hypothetical protein
MPAIAMKKGYLKRKSSDPRTITSPLDKRKKRNNYDRMPVRMYISFTYHTAAELVFTGSPTTTTAAASCQLHARDWIV